MPLVTVERRKRGGDTETLLTRLSRSTAASPAFPVRDAENGAPGTRSCTMDFKMRVIAKWLKSQGATPANPATVLIGFSWDEAHRVGKATARAFERIEYPLLDLRLARHDCQQIILRAGLPLPPKSACWFCPYHRPSVWAEMRRDRPVLFWKAADLERLLNERRDRLGKNRVYLTRFGKPLDEAVPEDMQADLDFGSGPGETCDEGYCWT